MLGALAAALVIGTWAVWFWLMSRVRIPRNRLGFLLASGLGAILGIAAIAAGAGTAGGVLGVLGGVVFLALAAFSGQARVKPAVSVGSPILDFTAADEHGKPFALSSLRGRPFLLKFFRGHW